MVDTLPYEIINHISSFLPNADHGLFVTSTSWIHEACHDETKRKYAMKTGVDYFCANGDLEMVKYCHRVGMKFTNWDMDWAARNGHLEMVKFLNENRTEGCTSWAMDWAARNGHLEIVKFLHENRTEGCTDRAMDCAEKNGHTKVVAFLKSIQ
jgi:hypothetical protein